MTWRPKTLQDALDVLDASEDRMALDSEEREVLRIQDRESLGVELHEFASRKKVAPVYRCTCGNARKAALIVDCRGLPGIAEDWACDGCWTRWERTGRDIDGAGAPTDRREWRERWVTAHEAPQEVVDKIRATRRPEAYRSRRGR